jgi:hypothetical protein
MGSENANMPMKCIDQMPNPMETAPRISQALPAEWFDSATREASRNEVKDTKIATPMDRETSQGL